MSFFFDLPALFAIGGLLYLVGKHFELERLAKITIGILIVSCFTIFSMMLYFDVFNFNFPAIGFTATGSQIMFRWPLPVSWFTGFTKEFVPSLVVFIYFCFIRYRSTWGMPLLFLSLKTIRELFQKI